MPKITVDAEEVIEKTAKAGEYDVSCRLYIHKKYAGRKIKIIILKEE